MKRLFLFSLFLSAICLPVAVMAAPFMVCDPQSGVTHYKLTGPAWLPTNVTAQTDGSLRVDVAGAVVGVTNSITIQACKNRCGLAGGLQLGGPFRLYKTRRSIGTFWDKTGTIIIFGEMLR